MPELELLLPVWGFFLNERFGIAIVLAVEVFSAGALAWLLARQRKERGRGIWRAVAWVAWFIVACFGMIIFNLAVFIHIWMIIGDEMQGRAAPFW